MSKEQTNILVLTSGSAYPRRLLAGVMNYARQHPGWRVLHVLNSPANVVQALQYMRPAGLIGQIVNPALGKVLEHVSFPIVNVTWSPQSTWPTVTMDNAMIGTLAAEHLLERAHRHLACLITSYTHYGVARAQGFQKCAAEASAVCHVFDIKDIPITPAMDTQTEIGQAIRCWLMQLPKPVGLFLANSYQSFMAPVWWETSIRVPDDLACVTVGDDSLSCESDSPALTSVDYPAEAIGYEAASLLQRLMAGAEPPPKPMLVAPIGVTARASTDSLAVHAPALLDAMRYIRKHADRPMTVTDVVNAANLSRATLERRFRTTIGRSVGEVIRTAHLDLACRLLVSTDDVLKVIAKRSGLVSAQHLCDLIRKVHAMSPTEFRRRNRSSG